MKVSTPENEAKIQAVKRAVNGPYGGVGARFISAFNGKTKGERLTPPTFTRSLQGRRGMRDDVYRFALQVNFGTVLMRAPLSHEGGRFQALYHAKKFDELERITTALINDPEYFGNDTQARADAYAARGNVRYARELKKHIGLRDLGPVLSDFGNEVKFAGPEGAVFAKLNELSMTADQANVELARRDIGSGQCLERLDQVTQVLGDLRKRDLSVEEGERLLRVDMRTNAKTAKLTGDVGPFLKVLHQALDHKGFGEERLDRVRTLEEAISLESDQDDDFRAVRSRAAVVFEKERAVKSTISGYAHLAVMAVLSLVLTAFGVKPGTEVSAVDTKPLIATVVARGGDTSMLQRADANAVKLSASDAKVMNVTLVAHGGDTSMLLRAGSLRGGDTSMLRRGGGDLSALS